MGQPLYCSAANAGLCVVVRGAVGGEAMVMAPATAGDSALSPCFHGCPLTSTGFSHHSLLPHIPSIRLLQSTAALALGLLHSPYPPAPSPCAACGMCGCSKDCLILIPFRLPQVSYFPFSLKCFSSDSDNCPYVGVRPRLQVPHLRRAGPGLRTLPFPPLVPSSY